MNSTINNKEVNYTFGLYFLGKAQKEFDTDLKRTFAKHSKKPTFRYYRPYVLFN